jgi:hypothetical protein
LDLNKVPRREHAIVAAYNAGVTGVDHVKGLLGNRYDRICAE